MPNNVDFITAVKMFFMNYANFKGRSTRAEYWWAMLGMFLISLILGWISDTLSGIFSLAIIFPSLAILTPRFHDIGKSGWWVVGLYAANIIGAVLMFGGVFGAIASGALSVTQMESDPTALYSAMAGSAATMSIGGILVLAASITSLVFCVTKSAPDNQYGPDPYGAE